MKPWLLNQGFHDLEFYFAEAVTEVAAIGSDMRWLRMAVVVGVMLTGGGFGVQLGTSAARVALEIFIEPQCSHCARLMMFHGGETADYIYSGDLRVTYRPVTFLDNSASGYSHRVGNAISWQANPASDDQYLATIGKMARLAQHVVDRIAAGEPDVDTVGMDNANRKRLNQVLHLVATPTVYDLNTHQVVDTSGNDWLKRLVGHS